MSLGIRANADNTATFQLGGLDILTIKPNEIANLNKINGAPIQKSSNLKNLLHPSVEGGWRDVYRSGWLPYWINQQWGGSQWGNLPDGSNGDIATGNVQDDTFSILGTSATAGTAGDANVSFGFKVSDSQTPTIVFVKVYKVGNPADNFQVQVWSDNGSGLPLAPLGSLGSISAKQITSKSDGEWYVIQLASPALVAGTQYHLVYNRSGAVDAVNYYGYKCSSNRKYPHGQWNRSGTTNGWVATSHPELVNCFLIPNPAANAFLQPNGLFDGRIVFTQGNPVNQSKFLCKPMKSFFNGQKFTSIIRGQAWAKGSTIADYAYGIDHERLVIKCNSVTGFLSAVFYPDGGGTNPIPVPISTTVDISTGAPDIVIRAKFENNGSDYIEILVNGVTAGIVINQSFYLSNDWKDYGTAILGGGFDVAPTWAVDTDMSVLPSLAGWTYTTNGSGEAFQMSVINGKLYQSANGLASAQYGYYSRNLALSNANGWAVVAKFRVMNSANMSLGSGVRIGIYDGTKTITVDFSEYFAEVLDGQSGLLDLSCQADFKSQENVIVITGKGSDYYVFMNGKLIVDGTGHLTGLSASNSVVFGDASTAAGDNADVVWDYIKILDTGMFIPKGSNGASLSEYGFWDGDQKALTTSLFNNNVPASIREVCGVEKNYVGEHHIQSENRRGVANQPSTAATSSVTIPDMECFLLGDEIEFEWTLPLLISTAVNYGYISDYVDGVPIADPVYNVLTGNWQEFYGADRTKRMWYGLHKLEKRWYLPAYSLTTAAQQRKLSARSKL